MGENPKDTERVYRADIDGLRALAVISVVIFHAFPDALRGGFVGVDIFYVISGYLITGILTREYEKTGRISYPSFMMRRLRRLMPSLMLLLFALFGLGFALLMRDEFRELLKQIVAGTFFSANILFWSQSGYFDAASEFKPLLHLWSLGIEEQFYFLWPTLLGLILLKAPGKVLPITAVLGLSSLIVCVWQTPHDSSSTFFLLPARFWELIAGAMLTLWEWRQSKSRLKSTAFHSPRVQNFFSILGVSLMLAGIAITKRDGFPSAWPLLPVLGTVFYIFAGSNAWFNRKIFSAAPMVNIGLISYPLYLWHWPLLSFAYILTGERPLNHWLIAAVALAFVCATLSYQIFEKRTHSYHWQEILRYLVIPLIALSILSACFIESPALMKQDVAPTNRGDIGHDAFHTYADQNFTACTEPLILQGAEIWGKHTRCHQSRKDGPPEIVLLGDSHAEQLFFGIAEQLPQTNVIYLIRGGLPLLAEPKFDSIFRFIKQTQSIRSVIINSFWAKPYDDLRNLDSFESKLFQTVEDLKAAGKNVVLMDDGPLFAFEPTVCARTRLLSRRGVECLDEAGAWSRRNQEVAKVLKRVAERAGLQFVSTSEILKAGKGYAMARDGALLYRDRNHLNILGSRLYGQWLADRHILQGL